MFWHNTQSEQRKKLLRVLSFAKPLIKRSHGSYIVDAEGKEYLDFASGQVASLLGHSHPELIKAINEQSKKAINLGSVFVSDILLEALDLLSSFAPNYLNRYIFLSTGTEANEFALRLGKAYNQKTCVVGFDRGYYGSSFYTSQLTVLGNMAGVFPKAEGVLTIKAPYCFKCPLKKDYPGCMLACLDEAANALKVEKGDISVFIVEPVLSVGGIIVPPPDYFKKLSEIAVAHGALIVADEAQTGMGRTGKWFAFQHWEGFIPDIVILAKGAGGGYPVSIVMTNEKIEGEAVKQGFAHISSHMNDPIAAAAFCAVVKIVKGQSLLQEAREKGAYFKNKLISLKDKYAHIIGDVRGIGLMLGFEVINAKEANPGETARSINNYCASSGLILSYFTHNSIFRICPPLTVSKKEIDQAMLIIESALKRL